jgi:hypothetical protein
MELYLSDLSEDEVRDLLTSVRLCLGDRVRSRTLLRFAWEDERRPVRGAGVVYQVVPAPRQRRIA